METLKKLFETLTEFLPVSLIPYVLVGGALGVTALCFALAYLLNRE